MNFFKDEIEHLGDKLQTTVKQAGEGLELVVIKASEELAKQRTLTKTDMQELIQFAVQEVGISVDQRLEKAKMEVGDLLDKTSKRIRNMLLGAAGLVLIFCVFFKWF